jgi:hypothetical protein
MFHRHLIVPTLAALICGGSIAPTAGAVDVLMMQNDLIQFTEQSFIQNVFGNYRTYNAAREHAENALQVQIDFVANAVPLSDDQKNKLELAGRGDIHRFFTDYERVKRGMTFGGIPRDEWQEVWQKTQPLSTRFAAGLHGARSLLAKSITSTLAPEQKEVFDAMKRQRDTDIYLDHIRMTLALIDRKIPLTRQQRDTVTQMLIRGTTPPLFYGQSNSRLYVVLLKMTELPEEELRAVFNQDEWKIVDALLRQARAMERSLQQQLEALGQ